MIMFVANCLNSFVFSCGLEYPTENIVNLGCVIAMSLQVLLPQVNTFLIPKNLVAHEVDKPHVSALKVKACV